MREGLEVIKTSIKGRKPINQDSVRVYSDVAVSVLCIADGLGSAIKSSIGSRLVCRAVVDCVRKSLESQFPLSTKAIVQRWHFLVSKTGMSPRDCMTTCSFVIVNQHSKKVTIGRIGDSAIYVEIDGVVMSGKEQKDFLNETEALGDGNSIPFSTESWSYCDSVRVLLATDGICDELDDSSISSLMEYLATRYNCVSLKSRNHKFSHEIRSAFGNKNYDDKSIVFAWMN